MTTRNRVWTRAGLLPALLASLGSAPASNAAEDDSLRVTVSSYYAREGRNQDVPDRISRDEVPAGEDAAAKTGRRSDRRDGGAAPSATPNTEFWFYTVDVELFADEDLDGYFYGIDVLFDADTIYEDAEVYAVLYLSREGGPWYEYAATDPFPLHGATGDDDFVVVSELLTGYPSGSYDILIELYDTWDDSFVADIGPESSPELTYLPLEDQERDQPTEPPVVVDDGGGAADPVLLFLAGALLAAAAVRRRRRNSPVRQPADMQQCDAIMSVRRLANEFLWLIGSPDGSYRGNDLNTVVDRVRDLPGYTE